MDKSHASSPSNTSREFQTEQKFTKQLRKATLRNIPDCEPLWRHLKRTRSAAHSKDVCFTGMSHSKLNECFCFSLFIGSNVSRRGFKVNKYWLHFASSVTMKRFVSHVGKPRTCSSGLVGSADRNQEVGSSAYVVYLSKTLQPLLYESGASDSEKAQCH